MSQEGPNLNDRRLVYAIIEYLQDVLRKNRMVGGKVESVEVAIQVLRTAFDIDASDAATLDTQVSLASLFEHATANFKPDDVSPEDVQAAETLKNEGNDFMSYGEFAAATEKYSEAIRLNRSPIYFCNRAAAYSKLGQHQNALDDCLTAVRLNPNYCKAYGRMGLAYYNLGKYGDAARAYRRAYELDPNNESFICNMRLAETKAAEQQQQQQGPNLAPDDPASWIPTIAQLINSPGFRQAVQNISQMPAVQSLLNTLGAQTGTSADSNPVPEVMDIVQSLAQAFELNNPNFIANLLNPQNSTGQNDNPSNSAGGGGSGGSGGGGAGGGDGKPEKNEKKEE